VVALFALLRAKPPEEFHGLDGLSAVTYVKYLLVKVALYIGSERILPLVSERWSVWLFLAWLFCRC